jgi:hypothetical protein
MEFPARPTNTGTKSPARLPIISAKDVELALKRVPSAPKDRYRSPRDYPSWNLCLAEILMVSGMTVGPEVTAEILKKDPASNFTVFVSQMIIANELPTKYLGAAIAESFLVTQLPENLPPPMLPVPCCILVLPRGFLRNEFGHEFHIILTTDNLSLYAYLKEVFQAQGAPDDLISVTESGFHKPGLRSMGITANGEAYATTWYWDREHRDERSKIPYTPLGMSEKEEPSDVMHLGNLINQIVVNAWLTMTYEPKLIDLGPTARSSSAVRGFDSKGRKVPQAPSWIGWRYRRLRGEERPVKGVEGATGRHVRPHWRCGHWRSQIHGEGRKLRRPIWIKPVWINPVIETNV